jgi:hypothetical protein
MCIYKWLEGIFERLLKKNLHICDGCGLPIAYEEMCEDCSVERRFVI